MLYRIVRVIFTVYLYCLNRFRVIGRENLVQDGSVIVFGNHYSLFDIVLLNVAVKRPIRFMAKHTLFRVPVWRSLVKAYGAFPVDRTRADLTAVKTAIRLLRNGEVVGIFPEGTRVNDPSKDVEAKGGLAMIAHKTNAVLQPVRLKYKRRFCLFNSMEVVIGKPIPVSELGFEKPSSEDYQAAGQRLLDAVYEM